MKYTCTDCGCEAEAKTFDDIVFNGKRCYNCNDAKKTTFICKYCGKESQSKANMFGEPIKKFCDSYCRDYYRFDNPVRVVKCRNCDVEFKARRRSYCSSECKKEGMKKIYKEKKCAK